MEFNPRNVRFKISKVNVNQFGILVSYKGSDMSFIIVKGTLSYVKGKFIYMLDHKEKLYQFVYSKLYSLETVTS